MLRRAFRVVCAVLLVLLAIWYWHNTGSGLRFLAFLGGTIYAASRSIR